MKLPKKVALAVREYRDRPEINVQAIAERHGISVATLLSWVKAQRVPGRRRGRRKLVRPTPRHKAILDRVALYSYEDVAQQLGVTKQEVGRVVKRWRAYAPPRQAPFKVGDVLHCDGRLYTVYDADFSHGTVIDDRGTLIPRFAWKRPHLLEKVGETTVDSTWFAKPVRREGPAATS